MDNHISAMIVELKQKAMSAGLRVRFHDHKTNAGDFCIFIYDKSYRPGYTVGFDGSYGRTNDDYYADLIKCINQAYHWIDHRDKRFVMVDGKWMVNKLQSA